MQRPDHKGKAFLIKLLKELTPYERVCFIKTAEKYFQRGYPSTENLFYYCYFLTIEKRVRELASSGDVLLRYLQAHSQVELNEQIRYYKDRIEEERKKNQWCPPSEWPPAIT